MTNRSLIRRQVEAFFRTNMEAIAYADTHFAKNGQDTSTQDQREAPAHQIINKLLTA